MLNDRVSSVLRFVQVESKHEENEWTLNYVKVIHLYTSTHINRLSWNVNRHCCTLTLLTLRTVSKCIIDNDGRHGSPKERNTMWPLEFSCLDLSTNQVSQMEGFSCSHTMSINNEWVNILNTQSLLTCMRFECCRAGNRWPKCFCCPGSMVTAGANFTREWKWMNWPWSQRLLTAQKKFARQKWFATVFITKSRLPIYSSLGALQPEEGCWRNHSAQELGLFYGFYKHHLW